MKALITIQDFGIRTQKAIYSLLPFVIASFFSIDMGIPVVRIPQDYPSVQAALSDGSKDKLLILDATKGPFEIESLFLEHAIMTSVNGTAHLKFVKHLDRPPVLSGHSTTISGIKFSSEADAVQIDCTTCQFVSNHFVNMTLLTKEPHRNLFGNFFENTSFD